VIKSMMRHARAQAVRQAINDVGEFAQVVRDGKGSVVAIVVPTCHPAFRKVAKALGSLRPDQIERLEKIRKFLVSETFSLQGRAGMIRDIGVDVLFNVYLVWCGEEKQQPINREQFVGALRSLGFPVYGAGDRIAGLAMKHHVLADAIVESAFL